MVTLVMVTLVIVQLLVTLILFREIGIGSALTKRPPFTIPLSCCRLATSYNITSLSPYIITIGNIFLYHSIITSLHIIVIASIVQYFTYISTITRNLTDPGTLQACQSAQFTHSSFSDTFNQQIYFDKVPTVNF